MSERDQHPAIFRPLQQVVLVFLGLVLLSVAISAWLTVREQEMLSRAGGQLDEILSFQEAQRIIELELIAQALGGGSLQQAELVRRVDELIDLCPARSIETRRHLLAFRRHLDETPPDAPDREVRSFAMFREVAELEARDEVRLLSEVGQETEAHRRYELAAPAVILAIAVLLLPLTWWRIVRPLEDFGRQISGLERGDFVPTPEGEVDELTLPLHRSFLKLAFRLQELEEAHRVREASLEHEVRTATTALLEQQRSLARAERLAATGELAASVAHEVRNPLAGIQMSLANVREELDDPALVERVDLVLREVERLSRLVNELVDSARHAPEPLVELELSVLVDELIALTRYQLPENVHLGSRIEQGLRCRLPRERLRQALLNLVLNAAGALADLRGEIEIEARQEGDGLRIGVSDDGPGFVAEVLEGGVRPFVSSTAHGTGLGLAMVRRFARDLNGSLDLSNRSPGAERAGAQVTLTLPGVLLRD